MKKLVLLVVLATTFVATSFAQRINYRVGIATSLPLDIYSSEETHLSVGSVMLEADGMLIKSNKIVQTLNAGYLRFGSASGTFTQIPILLGAKYKVSPTLYFGAAAGVSVNTDKSYGKDQFTYSPYLGVQVKKVNVEARFLNSSRKDDKTQNFKTLGLVFGYTF